MGTVHIQRLSAGFSVEGGEPLPLGIAQRRAIDLAVGLDGRVTIAVKDADPETYEFSPGAAFEWMTLGKTRR